MTQIQPRLLGIYSSRFDTQSGAPSDPVTFCEWIDVEVEAERGAEIYGGEQFAVWVCTATWLERELQAHPALWGRKYLVVQRWNHALVSQRIAEVCSLAAAADWPTVVLKLSRYLSVDTIDSNPYA